MKKVSIKEVRDAFQLELIVGDDGLTRTTKHTDPHRPGLQLTGFTKKFPKRKIQVLGNQEIYYLRSLSSNKREKVLEDYLNQKPICLVITNGHSTDFFKKDCERTDTPLLSTTKDSHDFCEQLSNFLQRALAKEIGIHGVCMNVYGVGVLIRGDSGVGKSEAALSLINKGHRLIADDLVILRKIGPSALIGTHNEINKDFLALRGIGLVNIPKIFGSGSSQDETKINLDIQLSFWDENAYYDAMQTEIKYIDFLNTKVKHIVIPVRPGRDISELIEVAAKTWRLEQEGYFAFEDFQSRLS